MDASTTRQRQAASRREQLLQVALEMFAERGVAEVSMKDLAAQAGVAIGLSYHYFPSKEELVRAVIAHNSPLPEITATIARLPGLPVRDGLILVVDELARLLEKNRPAIKLIFQELMSPRAGALSEVLQVREQVFGRLIGYLQERAEAGEVRTDHPEIVIHLLISSLLVFHALGTPVPADDVVETLLTGILTAPA